MPSPNSASAPSLGCRFALAASARACLLALTLAAAVNYAGCEEDDSAPPGAQASASAQSTMKFNVDPALVGPMQSFEDFNVQLAPPAGWDRMPDEQVAAVAAAAGLQATPGASPAEKQAAGATTAATGPADTFSAEPLAVFASPDRTMWLIVSAVDAPDPSAFEAALRSAHNVLNAESFFTSDIEVCQYLVRPPKLVNLKLLLSALGRKDPRRLQLDYVFPEQRYAESGRILESSLGSIRPIGQNGA